MRILVIADPNIPVPPPTYGGTERIAALVAGGLAARGHRVTLMAGPGSRAAARVIVHRPAGIGRLSRARAKLSFFARSTAAACRADAVINFGRTDYLLGLLALSRTPVIAHFENPIAEAEIRRLIQVRRARLALVSASDAQRAHVSHLGRWRTIHNAVDTNLLRPAPRPDPPCLVFLGRLVPDKGVHTAIEVARTSGANLVIAGNTPDPEYFERAIRPHLNGRIQYTGEIDDRRKPELFSRAAALLFPIEWDEPFGIVVAEALSCGVPVIAFDRGAVREIVRHGDTGFIVRNAGEMAAAVRALHRIDRRRCREDAERRFSVRRLISDYEDLLCAMS